MQTERIAPPPSHEKQQKLSNGSSGGGAGSKFADVQRRWNNGEVSNANGSNSGEYSDVNAAVAPDRQTPTPSPFVPSGSTPVKSLTGRFDKENLLADFESCADVTALVAVNLAIRALFLGGRAVFKEHKMSSSSLAEAAARGEG